jgi:hypothetical protein
MAVVVAQVMDSIGGGCIDTQRREPTAATGHTDAEYTQR